MSDDPSAKPYNPHIVNAWAALAALVAAGVFLAFCFNGPLTHLFHWVWNLIRYLARPII